MKKSRYIRFLIFTLIAATLFFCRGGSLAMTMSDMDMNAHASGMPCCDLSSETGSVVNTIAALPVQTAKEIGLLSIIFVFTFFIPFRRALRMRDACTSYIKNLIARIGAWRDLSSLVYIFRLGILHPKTW